MKFKNLKRSLLVSAAAAALMTASLPAATLTWDPLNTANGATIDDGAGSWTALNVWNNGAGNQTWSSVTPDSAIFTGTVGGTVTLASNINAGTVLINGAQNYTFSGSLLLALSTTGGLTVDNAASSTITFNTNIGGPGGITKRGAGTMILSGPSASFNTFGNVSVEEGVLRIATNTAVNTAIARTITVASGAALESRANTFSSGTATNIVLNGTGIGGAGALRISTSTQSYSAGTRISLGSDAKIAADGLIPNGVTLNSVVDLGSHTLTWGGNGTTSAGALVTINGYFRGTTGGFILDLGVANSLVTFVGGQSNTYTGQTWVRGGRILFNRGGTSNAIRGDGIARVSGDGSTNGVLADLYIGGGPVAATVLDTGNGTDLIADSAEVFMAATGTPTLQIGSGASTFTDTIGSLASANTGASLILSANATLTVNNGNGGSDGSGNTTFAGVISGAGNLAKSRSGTFTLTGANTYTGTTTVRQGVLNIQNALALGGTAGGTSVLSGGSLQLQNAPGMTVAGEALNLAGFGVANDGALRNISGNNTWTGAVTLTGSTRINSDSGLLTLAAGIGGVNQNLTVGGAGDTAITGAIATGTGGLVKDGAGTLTLSGSSTYTGVTSVKGGTLLLDFNAGGTADIIAPASALSLGGGTLALKGGTGETDTQTFNGLSGTGGTLNLNANGATSLTADLGAISLTGAYNFTGADTTVVSGLAVSGVSNYITTTVAGANNGLGRLGASLWNGSTWASTATNGSGTTFVVPWQGVFVDLTTNSYNLTPASFTNTTGDLRILDGTAAGTAVTYNANTTVSSIFMVAPTFDTTVAIAAGTTLNLDDGSGFGTVAIGGLAKSLTLGDVVNQGVITSGTAAGAGLALRNTGPTSLLTVNAVIADNAGGAVSLNTEGTVVLRGTNTYTGATGISAGTLQIAGDGSLGGGNYAGAIVNDGLLRYSASVNQTLSGVISGGGGITKDGTGNLVLSGASTYSGDTTIATGTLRIAGAGSLGGGNYVGAIANSGTLQYSSSAGQTLSGAISGTGDLLKDGAGTLTLTGTNTYTGDTTIATGTLRLADAGSLGNGSYAPSILNNGTFQYSATTTQVLTGNMTGSGNLLKDGTGTLSLTGANTYAGSTTVNGGTLQLDFSAGNTSDIAPVTSALALNGGILLLNGGSGVNTQAFNGLGGTGGTLELRKNLATKVELNLGEISTTAGYRFIGGDTTHSGFNAVAGNTNFVTTTQAGANDATSKLGASIWSFLDSTPDTWASTAEDIGGTTYVVPWNGAFTSLTTNGFNLTPASFTNTTGDLRITDGTAAGTAVSYTAGTTIGSMLMVAPNFSTTVAITAGTTLTVGSGDGALGVVAIASKGLGLSLGNVVNQGVITAGTGPSASTLVLQNLDTVAAPGTVLTVNSVIANNGAGGAVSLSTAGAVVLSSTSTYTGNTTIVGGTLRIAVAGGLGSGNYAGNIIANGTLQYASSAAQTLSGVISGTGGITKDTNIGAPSTLTLSGANTYGGVTAVNSGVLNIQNSSALGSTVGATTVAAGATLQMQGGIAVGAEALTLNGTGLSATGALRNISGDNSWSGAVTLASAARINSDAGRLTISGNIGGTDQNLTVGGAGDTTISGVIGTVAGTLTKDGAGTLTLSAVNTYTGDTTVSAGTLMVSGSGSLASGNYAGAIVNDAALQFATSASQTLSGVISGGGTLTQSGPATLTLTGANTYTGATTVTGGTLSVATIGDGGVAGNLGAATNAAANLVIGDATLQYTGATASTDRGFTLGDGTTATVEITDSAANLTFTGGAAATTGALTKTGAGTLTLSGANPFAFTGVTTVAGGTLALDLGATSNVLGPSNAVAMTGGTLDFLGATTNTQTLASLDINSGANFITKSTFTGTVANGGGVDLGVINLNSGTFDIAALPVDPAGFGSGTQDSWIKASGMAPTAYIGAAVTTNGGRDLVSVNSLNNLVVADSTPYARGATGISSTLSAVVKFVEMADGGRFGAGFNNTGTADVDATITLHTTTQLDPVTGLVVPGSHHTYWQGLLNAYLGGTTTLDIGAGNTLHLSDTAPITSMAGSDLVITGGNLTAGTGDSGTGTITPDTPGTLTVATNRTVTIASTIMDNGTGVVNLTANGTPTGTLTLTGANTYTGETAINGGFVNVASAENAGVSGPLGVGGVISFAGGTLQYSSANTFDYSSRFSTAASQAYSVDTNGQNVVWATALGSSGGTLTKSGTGVLTLTADNVAVTATTVSGGVLRVGDGGVTGTLGSGPVAIAADATLAFDRSDTITVANALSGAGAVLQDGAGETIITGDNTGLTGLTTVNRGKLVLDSTLASVLVNSGATLGGVGTVRGDLINRGFLSPGHSPGNIVVAGNFTQTASGTFNEEIESPSSFDTMTVGGSGTLDGTLHVISFGGFTPTIGETYTIITAAGGVNGAFSTVVDDWADLRVIVTYNPDNVVLSFALAALQPRATNLGLTPNRIATAGGIDGAVAADPAFAPLFDSITNLDDARFSRALASLSPQGFERLWDDCRYNAVLLNNAVESRLQSTAWVEPDENIWIQAIRRVSQMDGDKDIEAGSAQSTGVIIGADTAFGSNFTSDDKFTVGAMFEYSNDDVNMGFGSRSRVNRYLPGIYARYRAGDAFVDAVGSYGYADYSSRRRIDIGSDQRTAKSRTESVERTVSVRAGYEFHVLNNALTFAPYAGFAHTRWETDGFTETGAGLANLSVHDMKAESTVSRLGVLANAPIHLGELTFIPRVDVAWRHEFQQSRRDITANFGPSPFTVRTMRPATDAVEARAGLDVKISPRTTIYADFGCFWDGSHGHSEEYRLGVNVKF